LFLNDRANGLDRNGVKRERSSGRNPAENLLGPMIWQRTWKPVAADDISWRGFQRSSEDA
jgi:hypothetical protein